MKKFLIIVILILLLVLTYFLTFNRIKIFKWKNSNIEDIHIMSDVLDTKISEAMELKDQKYPSAINKVNTSMTDLKKAREKYQNKMKYISDNVELGVVEVKQYKIERLWIVLQNYAKNNELDLKLDIVETQTTDIYDLNITTTGSYMGITNFIYNIEKDDTLGFKILNFKILRSTDAVREEAEAQEQAEGSEVGENTQNKKESKPNENTSESSEEIKLTATFKIENVGIDFE